MISSETLAAPRGAAMSPAIRWIGVAYALVPLAMALSWFAVGNTGEIDFRAPMDLYQLVELGTILAALRGGLPAWLARRRPGRAQAIALAVLVAVFAWGLLVPAPHPFEGLMAALLRLVHVLFALSLCFLLSRTGRAGSVWITGAVAAGLLLHVPVIAWMLERYPHEGQAWLGGPLGFWHVRIWALFLAAALAAVLGLHAGLEGWRRAGQAGVAAVLLVLWTLLFWSGSRTGMVGVGAAALVAAVVQPGPVLRRLPLFAATGLAGAALSLALPNPIPAYGLLRVVDETQAAQGLNAMSSNRLQIWSDVLTAIADRPWLGHGHDQIAFVLDLSGKGLVHAHNAVLDMLFDFGVVGTAALLFLLLSFLWRGLLHVTRDGERWKLGALAMLAALAAMAMLEGVLYHDEPLTLVAIGYAVLLARPRDAA